MIKQLKAAAARGQPVYLAVSDIVGMHRAALLRALKDAKLDYVNVVTFSEERLKAVSIGLRKGLALSAAIVASAAEQPAYGDYEYADQDNPQ
jgi:hypothetical protein